ncbi:multicopper oxidase domain-containing protein [Pseudoalteromonas luteoviolacea]|uniref:multicopper oxidase family protein n=1 Tax=Pseudoalteromonas luteoviolacea TaxID=43657 RepID=UPI001B3A720F|nr:multicopper oxidase family protein [Pseudoalteromonas luteoviolacea]MBQ4878658.1 multicopper oxidase domain-containing protein [Pseudoalteromonas luteoviolacea]MBQ4907198.1 multicopper oxidase domain-containing protein [Pseudoalteromonas luteoviolacea]
MRMKKSVFIALSAILSASCSSLEPVHTHHKQSQWQPTYFDVKDYNPTAYLPSSMPSSKDCEYEYIPPELAPFENPEVLSSIKGELSFTMAVQYQQREIAKCNTWLRNYAYKQNPNDKFKSALVGPTLRLAPGEILRFRLENRLPGCDKAPDYLCAGSGHGSHHSDELLSDAQTKKMNTPHNFNVTNFHTHGLWVSPSKRSDNVLLEIQPGKGFEYEIRIPEDHPQGTFWYHAHVHGSTALQVSSGMAGAIIIESDTSEKNIATQPQIKGKADNIFVLQQVAYDCNGIIEYYEVGDTPADVSVCTKEIPGQPGKFEKLSIFGPGSWQKMQRRTLINGLVVPQIKMKPNEIQRWRFIHAGVRETVKLSVVESHWNKSLNPKPLGFLNQISVDGLNTGRLDRWDLANKDYSIEPLQPGYRADYLYQAPSKAGVYWLVDLDSASHKSLQGVPEDTAELLQIVVEGSPVGTAQAKLPTSNSLLQYQAHKAPTEQEIRQMTHDTYIENMMFYLGERASIKGRDNISCQDVINADLNDGNAPPGSKGGDVIFSVDGKPYGQIETRELELGQWQRWHLCTRGLAPMHPFHIHVNPFYAQRKGPDGNPQWVWRDTLAIEKDEYSGVPFHDIGKQAYIKDYHDIEKYVSEKQGKAPHIVIYSKYRYPNSLPGFKGNVKQQYTGDFVLHCHILDHEDQGMMQKVRLVDSKQ